MSAILASILSAFAEAVKNITAFLLNKSNRTDITNNQSAKKLADASDKQKKAIDNAVNNPDDEKALDEVRKNISD